LLDFPEYNQITKEEAQKALSKLFTTREGKIFFSHLKQKTINRVLGANCSSDELRYLEGQRHLVNYISSIVEKL
jgi:hypothetical protein